MGPSHNIDHVLLKEDTEHVDCHSRSKRPAREKYLLLGIFINLTVVLLLGACIVRLHHSVDTLQMENEVILDMIHQIEVVMNGLNVEGSEDRALVGELRTSVVWPVRTTHMEGSAAEESEGEFDLLPIEDNLVRNRRDASDNSTTPRPDGRRHSKGRSNRGKGSRNRDRGLRRRDQSGRQDKKNRSLNVIHLESYVRDEDWKKVAAGMMPETPYLHGTLSDKGFEPYSHTYEFWNVAEWCKNKVDFASYQDVSGHVRINKDGVYYIYSQVMYHDLTGRYAYGIYVNEMLTFQCMVTRRVGAEERGLGPRHGVYEQCFTAGATFIKKGSLVSIRNIYKSLKPKTLLNLDHFTYWGIMKL